MSCFLRRAGWRHFYVTVCLRLFFLVFFFRGWKRSVTIETYCGFDERCFYFYYNSCENEIEVDTNQLCGVTSLGKNFSSASFLSTLEDALRKKKFMWEKWFHCIFKIGWNGILSFLPISNWKTFLKELCLDCVSMQFLGNFWATFRPFSVYF